MFDKYPNLREGIFALAHRTQQHRELTRQESDDLFRCSLLEKTPKWGSSAAISTVRVILTGDLQKDAVPFPIEVALRRLEIYAPNLTYCPATVLLMILFGSESIGTLIMYLHSLVVETQVRSRAVTVKDWAMEIGPYGLPTEESLRQFWANQKDRSRGTETNAIDNAAAWKLEVPNGKQA